MHTEKKLGEQRKKLMAFYHIDPPSVAIGPAVASAPCSEPPPKKKNKRELKLEEAEQRRKEEIKKEEEQLERTRLFMTSFRGFIEEYDAELGVWATQVGEEALVKYASEVSRLRQLITKKEAESAATLGAPIQTNVLASFTAEDVKNESKAEAMKNDSN